MDRPHFLRTLWSQSGFSEVELADRARLADLIDELVDEGHDEEEARRLALNDYLFFLAHRQRTRTADDQLALREHRVRAIGVARLVLPRRCSSCRREHGEPIVRKGFDTIGAIDSILILCPRCLALRAPEIALPQLLETHEYFFGVTNADWDTLAARIDTLNSEAGVAIIDDGRLSTDFPKRQALDELLASLHERDRENGSVRGYLDGSHWQRVRIAARVLVGFRCEQCGDPPRDTHHTTYERTGRESLHDVVVLCRPCHAGLHGWSTVRRGS